MMNYKEFNKVCKEQSEQLEHIADALFDLELGGTDNIQFYDVYEQFLNTKLRYLHILCEYYRQMHERSFWFMKPLVARTFRRYCAEHCQTLTKLTLVRLYKDKLERTNNDAND